MMARYVPCGVKVPTWASRSPPPATAARASSAARHAVGGVIDHFARPEHVVGLKGGGWIGNVDLAVDAELIARAGVRAVDFAA